MPHIAVNKRQTIQTQRKQTKQQQTKIQVHFLHHLQTDVRDGGRKSTMLHVTICSKDMNNISLVFYIM